MTKNAEIAADIAQSLGCRTFDNDGLFEQEVIARVVIALDEAEARGREKALKKRWEEISKTQPDFGIVWPTKEQIDAASEQHLVDNDGAGDWVSFEAGVAWLREFVEGKK